MNNEEKKKSTLTKGKAKIRREEFLETFGIPTNAEIIGIELTDSGDIEISLISSEQVFSEEMPVTHHADIYRNHNNFRTSFLRNLFKPIAFGDDGRIIIRSADGKSDQVYKPYGYVGRFEAFPVDKAEASE